MRNLNSNKKSILYIDINKKIELRMSLNEKLNKRVTNSSGSYILIRRVKNSSLTLTKKNVTPYVGRF